MYLYTSFISLQLLEKYSTDKCQYLQYQDRDDFQEMFSLTRHLTLISVYSELYCNTIILYIAGIPVANNNTKAAISHYESLSMALQYLDVCMELCCVFTFEWLLALVLNTYSVPLNANVTIHCSDSSLWIIHESFWLDTFIQGCY